MVAPVEELLQIDIHYPAIPFGLILLRLRDGPMLRVFRSEAVTVGRERRVPLLLQHLQHRLLNESVDRRGNAELSLASVWLVDFYSSDRLRLIRTLQQLLSYLVPLPDQVSRQLIDSHSVDPCAALVRLDPSQRTLEILRLTYSLHQPFAAGRVFGCLLRHERFGPFFRILPGFTLRAVREGQFYLVFLPLFAHESLDLLTAPFTLSRGHRSGLQ